MISSTRADLNQYRKEAFDIIAEIAADVENRIQLLEVSMERETQSGDRDFAVAVSKHWVEESHWIVFIVAWNYGTISEEQGADGLSVTEWEYRHAKGLGKKLFVFVAGDPETAEQYRYTQGEEKDLKDWMLKQSADQTKKLNAFKRELTGPFVSKFASLQAFREALEKTLRRAIEDLPPDIQPGTPLAGLIVAVQPAIRSCIRKVTLVADCKSIHDHLHKLRQHVVRPLREEVLAVWKQEGKLTESRKTVILRCVIAMSRELGAIGEVRKSIGPEHQGLSYSVDRVVKSSDLWNIGADSPSSQPSCDEFTETVDAFADAVQGAFSEADRSMTREESNLRDQYLGLRELLNRGRRDIKLSRADERRLDEELQVLDAHRSRVRSTLTVHHSWQEAHDKLEEVNGFRDAAKFARKLQYYRDLPLQNVLALVNRELEDAGDGRTSPAPSTDAAVNERRESSPTPPATAGDSFVERLRGLITALKALEADASVHAFDEMRKPFDDAFFCVDQRTLSEVERARDRAIGLEEWLDALVAAPGESN